MSEEDAFWKSIGAAPDDQLPRLVFADWLEEQHSLNGGVVKCGRCGGLGWTTRAKAGDAYDAEPPTLIPDFATVGCPACDGERDRRGTGFVPDGRADLAEALRATADRVPYYHRVDRDHSWFADNPDDGDDVLHPESDVSKAVFNHLHSGSYTNAGDGLEWHEYPTAELAIRDLCRAWIAVNRKVEVAV